MGQTRPILALDLDTCWAAHGRLRPSLGEMANHCATVAYWREFGHIWPTSRNHRVRSASLGRTRPTLARIRQTLDQPCGVLGDSGRRPRRNHPQPQFMSMLRRSRAPWSASRALYIGLLNQRPRISFHSAFPGRANSFGLGSDLVDLGHGQLRFNFGRIRPGSGHTFGRHRAALG